MVDLDVAANPHHDRDVSLLSNLVIFWTGNAVEDRQWNVLETFLLGDFLQLGFVLVRILSENRDERGHLLVAVFSDNAVDLLDESDHFRSHLTSEDVNNRATTKLATVAEGLAFARTSDVLDGVWRRRITWLQTGLQFGGNQSTRKHGARNERN